MNNIQPTKEISTVWIVVLSPFVLLGYISQKIVAGFFAGWVISRDL